jgi:ribonuclease HI
MKTVELYTDGACSGNPGPGGWGYILKYGAREMEMSGGQEDTTNNRMELTAVIEGLKALKEPCIVELYSDSKYVTDALEKGWARSWQSNGWMRGKKEPALNPDLWERLLGLCEEHEVRPHWVKGHAGNERNNRCDKLAVGAIQEMKGAETRGSLAAPALDEPCQRMDS